MGIYEGGKTGYVIYVFEKQGIAWLSSGTNKKPGHKTARVNLIET
jgi:hypothetical protein